MVKLAGILNVTPDSFSDGGQFTQVDAAVAQGLRLREEGADWVDVGGESTRPGSVGISVDEECARVLPVVTRLVAEGVPVSIDTSKPEVARVCLQAGAVVVNDVNGLMAPGMMETVAEFGAGAVIMHKRGSPETMQQDTSYEDVVQEVCDYLSTQLLRARATGIATVWLDPGIGFGKSVDQNCALIAQVRRIQSLGAPVYIGASRKSFLGRITGEERPMARLPGSLAAAVAAAEAGAAVLRVHDVAETRATLAVWGAIREQRLSER